MGQQDYGRFRARDGVSVAYRVSGHGVPVVAVHGYTVTSTVNFATHWRDDGTGKLAEAAGPTIESALTGAGCQVVMLDLRGHGHSDRPHDPACYGMGLLADDVRSLIEHLGLERGVLLGYSLGAIISCDLLAEPWVSRVALCGTGSFHIEGEREEYADLWPTAAKCFLTGAWQEHPDYKALRAWARLDKCGPDFTALGLAAAGARLVPRAALAAAPPGLPVMVLNGGKDEGADPAWDLTPFIPGARSAVAGDGDHGTAPSDPLFHDELVRFVHGQQL